MNFDLYLVTSMMTGNIPWLRNVREVSLPLAGRFFKLHCDLPALTVILTYLRRSISGGIGSTEVSRLCTISKAEITIPLQIVQWPTRTMTLD